MFQQKKNLNSIFSVMSHLPIVIPLILILNVWGLVGVVYLQELILKKFEAMKIFHMPIATSRRLCEFLCDWLKT